MFQATCVSSYGEIHNTIAFAHCRADDEFGEPSDATSTG